MKNIYIFSDYKNIPKNLLKNKKLEIIYFNGPQYINKNIKQFSKQLYYKERIKDHWQICKDSRAVFLKYKKMILKKRIFLFSKKLNKLKYIRKIFEKYYINEIKNLILSNLVFEKENNKSTQIYFYTQLDEEILNELKNSNIIKGKIEFKKINKIILLKNLFIDIFYPLYLLIKFKIFPIKNYDMALNVYNAGIHLDKDYAKSNYWFLNHDVVKNKKTLFINEFFISKENRAYYKNSNFYSLAMNSVEIPFSKNQFFFLIKFFFSNIISSILLFYKWPGAYHFFFKMKIKSLIWKLFLNNVKFKNYMIYSDHDILSDIRNYYLKINFIKTIKFKDTNSEIVFDNLKEKYFMLENYNLSYDYEIHPSQESLLASKLNFSKSKVFLTSNPIWTSNYFNKKIFNNKKFTISIFPTSLNLGSVNKDENFIKFFKFIKDIDEIYNFDFLIKPKAILKSNNSVLQKYIDEFSKKKNFKFLNPKILSTYVINSSNLVICMPYASPGYDSLLLKKPIFFLDSTNSWPNSFYRNFEFLDAKDLNMGYEFMKFYTNNQNFSKIQNVLNSNKKRLNMNNSDDFFLTLGDIIEK